MVIRLRYSSCASAQSLEALSTSCSDSLASAEALTRAFLRGLILGEVDLIGALGGAGRFTLFGVAVEHAFAEELAGAGVDEAADEGMC
jgi:hypothetical protein